LILLMVAVAIAGIVYLRYNSYDRKIARRRAREDARRDGQNPLL
jgi:Tfp pilus assembly protein PilE